MIMKKVISNLSPLISLSIINELKILKDLFGQIIIPEAVYEEVIIKGKGEKGIK